MAPYNPYITRFSTFPPYTQPTRVKCPHLHLGSESIWASDGTKKTRHTARMQGFIVAPVPSSPFLHTSIDHPGNLEQAKRPGLILTINESLWKAVEVFIHPMSCLRCYKGTLIFCNEIEVFFLTSSHSQLHPYAVHRFRSQLSSTLLQRQ